MGCSRLSNVHARQRGYIFNRMASPMLKEKQQPANGTPPQVRAATRQRAATHVGGGVPDAPETSRHRPSPGPPRAGHARPLPRGGGQAPCRPQTPTGGSRPLPTDRPINECPPPYRAYVNYIRRAGCPHPAASSRSYPSTGSHPRRGRRPRRPGNLPPPPISGKTPGPGMPAPTARRRASPMPSANARGGVKTPPYGPPHPRVPAPRRKFARPHVNGQPPT